MLMVFGEKHLASGDAHHLTSACSLGNAEGYEKLGLQVCRMLLSGSKLAAKNISTSTFPSAQSAAYRYRFCQYVLSVRPCSSYAVA